ncbi:MAG TPA: hypothetical protein VF913_04565 [Xanthobacteraceae bacterium]
MFTKSMIAVSAAILLATASTAPAMVHSQARHHGPGFGQNKAAAPQHLKRFTADEKARFDWASRPTFGP